MFLVVSAGYRNRQTSKQKFPKIFREARGGGLVVSRRRFGVSECQTKEFSDALFRAETLSLSRTRMDTPGVIQPAPKDVIAK